MKACTRQTVASERGLALIIVLGMVVLFGVLAALVITSSKLSGISEKVNTERSRTRYAAESALGFAQWMVLNEPRNVSEDDEGQPLSERWQANASSHVVEMGDGVMATIRVKANNGYGVGSLASQGQRFIDNVAAEDGQLSDDLEVFFDTLKDYRDPDSNPSVNGIEMDDYRQQDLENFPRNGEFQFREEVYWIRNVGAFIDPVGHGDFSGGPPDERFRVEPPRDANGRINVHGGGQAGRSSFWSDDLDWLPFAVTGGLSADEMEAIRDCRVSSGNDAAIAQECLGTDLFSRLRNHVDFNPRTTTIFTIDVTARYPGGDISRRVVATLNLRKLPTAPRSNVGAAAQTLQYWRRQVD